ncbi:MAG: TetR/AcrR family transcriptional regulator [Mycobacteriaceae bacterium]|nr:TetR/AcrR family transcriptional regulator [Mycobacteriaceae bacterium]
MADRDALEQRILDAALERILQLGIRRASLDDIARRAGINRVTIYRRFTTKENLVELVLAREVRRSLAKITAVGSAATGVDAQIEQTMLALIREIRTSPIVTQLFHVTPEETLSFYTVRGEQLVQLGVAYIAQYIEQGQSDGSLDAYDPRPVAELLARLAHSILLTPVGGIDFDDGEQVRAFVRTCMVPLLKHGVGAAH